MQSPPSPASLKAAAAAIGARAQLLAQLNRALSGASLLPSAVALKAAAVASPAAPRSPTAPCSLDSSGTGSGTGTNTGTSTDPTVPSCESASSAGPCPAASSPTDLSAGAAPHAGMPAAVPSAAPSPAAAPASDSQLRWIKEFRRGARQMVYTTPKVSIDQVQILGSLGKGGEGMAFKVCVDESPLATKFAADPREEYATDLDGYRMVQEAVTMYNIHKNARDQGIDSVRVIGFTIDLMDGTLESMLSNEVLSVPTLLTIMCQKWKALSVLQATGVEHQDLKAPNMLIKKVDGRIVVRLADFGISMLLGQLVSGGNGPTDFQAPEHAAARRDVGADVPAARSMAVFVMTMVNLEMLVSKLDPAHARHFFECRRSSCGMGSDVVSAALARACDAMPGHLSSVFKRCLELDPTLRPTARKVWAEVGRELLRQQQQQRPQQQRVVEEEGQQQQQRPQLLLQKILQQRQQQQQQQQRVVEEEQQQQQRPQLLLQQILQQRRQQQQQQQQQQQRAVEVAAALAYAEREAAMLAMLGQQQLDKATLPQRAERAAAEQQLPALRQIVVMAQLAREAAALAMLRQQQYVS
ncbi:hypothetical protein FOA52_004029 [Chlamydomonas sp. UWO 241]|nr:hypothetical protein FOA52_004029 [Chlamydomonas sp. UWO 241]